MTISNNFTLAVHLKIWQPGCLNNGSEIDGNLKIKADWNNRNGETKSERTAASRTWYVQ